MNDLERQALRPLTRLRRYEQVMGRLRDNSGPSPGPESTHGGDGEIANQEETVKPSLRPGLTARLEYDVPIERTVPYLLPESDHFAALPAVLATGFLIGIVEWTCMRALEGHLDDGEQTLGVHVDLSHEAPTPPGSTLTVEAELSAVERRQLTFTVHAFDAAATVCRGTHRRAVIETERFLARLGKRAVT